MKSEQTCWLYRSTPERNHTDGRESWLKRMGRVERDCPRKEKTELLRIEPRRLSIDRAVGLIDWLRSMPICILKEFGSSTFHAVSES